MLNNHHNYNTHLWSTYSYALCLTFTCMYQLTHLSLTPPLLWAGIFTQEESNFSLHATQEGTHQTLWLHHQQRTEDAEQK